MERLKERHHPYTGCRNTASEALGEHDAQPILSGRRARGRGSRSVARRSRRAFPHDEFHQEYRLENGLEFAVANDYPYKSEQKIVAKHDPAFLEARLKRECPCRSLFVRNIQYGLHGDELRTKFEEYGEIRAIFDLIDRRGMVFIQYYDLRAAINAKAALQGYNFAGRKIDVHYSLPRDDEDLMYCDKNKNQGTLLIILRDGKEPLDNDALATYFSQFGEVKVTRDYRNRPNQKFIEFYDSRACVKAHDIVMGAPYNGGYLDCKYAWDISTKIAAKPRESMYSVQNGLEAYERANYDEYCMAGGYYWWQNRSHSPENCDLYHEIPDYQRDAYVFASPELGPPSPPIPLLMNPGRKGPSDFATLTEEERLEEAQKVQQMLAMINNKSLAVQQSPMQGMHGDGGRVMTTMMDPMTMVATQLPLPSTAAPVVNPVFLKRILQQVSTGAIQDTYIKDDGKGDDGIYESQLRPLPFWDEQQQQQQQHSQPPNTEYKPLAKLLNMLAEHKIRTQVVNTTAFLQQNQNQQHFGQQVLAGTEIGLGAMTMQQSLGALMPSSVHVQTQIPMQHTFGEANVQP